MRKSEKENERGKNEGKSGGREKRKMEGKKWIKRERENFKGYGSTTN